MLQPIAVVGLSFRFPGDIGSEQSFWEVLRAGRDVVTRIDPGRWAVGELQDDRRKEPGRSVTFDAGVLSHIDTFDAEFFGISPREAAWLDPQQRLMLELAWEAMEDGGIVPSSLAGTNTAVYVGISGLDYSMRGLDDLSTMTGYSMTGNTLSIAANRLSYVFDLRGPSLAVDTACSSSLVALHHACQTLQAGEAEIALVGGVNLLLHPYPFIGFSKASMLSSAGRCRVFSDAATGYVRSEGGAVLLLMPLERAQAEGRLIHGVILGTGVNADGARKTGLTIPSSEGQAELMASVLRRSGLDASQVDFVEAHGTGTAIGDPVEASALGQVYGAARSPDHPLPIGSVKSNLGHLETASGMAGLVKTLLVLKHGQIPPTLHCQKLNPKIDFTALNLQVVTRSQSLPSSDRPLIAGVNSFGFGGANAHVLVQAAPHVSTSPAVLADQKKEPVPVTVSPLPPLFLSAQTVPALREVALRHATALRTLAPEDYYDWAYSAAHHRAWLEKRLALEPSTLATMAEALDSFAQKGASNGIVLEEGVPEAGGVAFVYTGNGAQWVGMGRRLWEESPRFAEILKSFEEPLAVRAGFSLRAELWAGEESSRLDDTAVAQPLLFVVQVALTQWLQEQGVEPLAVTGHSVGEVAAAWAAGILTRDQALEVICARSAAQATTRGQGRMAAVGLTASRWEAWALERNWGEAVIAGYNGPGNLTLAGSEAVLDQVKAEADAQGVFFRKLDLDYAFHSPFMDPIKAGLVRSLAGLHPRPGRKILVSTVTGKEIQGQELGVHYWWDNVRCPVQFAPAIGTLADLGCRTFIEIGPHGILQHYLKECLASREGSYHIAASQRRQTDGLKDLERLVLRVHLWSPRAPCFSAKGKFLDLPRYPWQRQRHWLPTTSEGYQIIQRQRHHPLLGWRLQETQAAWEAILDPAKQTWLQDHRVGQALVLPGAAYVEMALAASREWFGAPTAEVEELDILAPVVFDGEHGRTLRFELHPRDGHFTIRSRQRLSEDEWTLHASGRLLGAPCGISPHAAPEQFPSSLPPLSRATHYRMTHALGLDYGPTFQGIDTVRVQADRLIATLHFVPALEAGDWGLPPWVLDQCFQSLVDFFQAEIEGGRGVPYLPVKMGRVKVWRQTPVIRFEALLKRRQGRSVTADFTLWDEAGHCVAELNGCRFRAMPLSNSHDPANAACWGTVAVLCPSAREEIQSPPGKVAEWGGQLRSLMLTQESDGSRLALFREGLPLFDALAMAFACRAFDQLGQELDGWVRDDSRCPAPLRPYFHWLRRQLQHEGWLQLKSGQWRLMTGELPLPEEIWRTLLQEYPQALPELVQLGHVGRHLSDLLSGRIDPLSFKTGLIRSPLSETLFEEAPAYSGIFRALTQWLPQLAADWPLRRRLRILEIGPGTATLAQCLKGVLPERLDYVLGHTESAVVGRLQVEVADYSWLHAAQLDATTLEPIDAPAVPAHYDLIILRHWLHGTDNPAHTVAAVRRWMAQGGLLILAERHADLSTHLTYGIDPSWWSPEEPDQGRLHGPQAWRAVLEHAGWTEVTAVTEPVSGEMAMGSYLMLAQMPEPLSFAEPSAPPLRHWGWLNPCPAGLEALGRLLRSQGDQVRVPDNLEDEQSLPPEVDHWVYFAPAPEGTEGQMAPTLSLFRRVQALARIKSPTPPRLWIVTQGGSLQTDPVPEFSQPAHGAVWGLGRVLMNEYPDWRVTLLDLQAENISGHSWAERVVEEWRTPGADHEIVLTREARYGLRITPLQAPATNSTPHSHRLDFRVPGQLRNLTWMPVPDRPLGDDDIEIRPHAVGLNFRDVMYVLGLLPDEAVEKGFAGASLGLECAGTVLRVGSGVHTFRAGDEVMGFGSACFSSVVRTVAAAVIHKPAHWSFEAAASVTTAFFTVYYALQHLAQVQPGERVLIHGGAGGVGIAAIQVAKHLGAEIFATAGTEEKRDFVHLLGADHVFDSRNLDYAEAILSVTGGEGVDVVLNSLAGEAIRRNLQVLKPFGRFLELGKRDFFENTPLGLRPFKDNISYFGIDADQILTARPDLAAKLFRELMALFRAGLLTPLPYRVFSGEQVVDAFRTMQQARHIGKIVVTLKDFQPRFDDAVLPTPTSLSLSAERTWLITGGIAGFGLVTARWLIQRGARHLVLVGRRGAKTPGAATALEEFHKTGATVQLLAADVTDEGSLRTVLTHIQENLPPLGGVVHAAMVLDDALLANQDEEGFRRVLAPKLLGAWHLHRLTADIPLEYFILYSSVTTLIGNPGQGNYVAANAYLESLAQQRRALGLPAACVAWGPVADAGYLTAHEALLEGLEARLGGVSLQAEAALDQMGQWLQTEGMPTSLTLANFSWGSLARFLPSAQSARFGPLRHSHDGDEEQESGDFAAQIAGKSPQEVLERVRHLVAHEVAQVLCMKADQLDPQRSLHDLGMDSLMAVELALGLEKRCGIQLPTMMLNEGPTLERISARIAEKLHSNQPEDSSQPGMSELVVALAGQHGEQLSATLVAETVETMQDLARRASRGDS